jgi:hypothetical protein
LLDGDIEEVENPQNPSGPSLFRLVIFKAIEKVKAETHKAKEDAGDFDFAFDDVDLGWAMEGQQQSIAEPYSWQVAALQ